MMNKDLMHSRLAALFSIGLGFAMLTTVAGTNLFVLLLLLTLPWAWRDFKLSDDTQLQETKRFLSLVVAICFWDALSNIYAGHPTVQVLKASLHDMRTLGFIFLLWPVFAVASVARASLWSLLGSVVVLASSNLLLTCSGYLEPGKYFWPTAPHMYGQMLVGFFFLLAQMLLIRPELSWRCALPMALLLASLFFASERRTGYLQLAAGATLWTVLNYQRLLVFKHRRWFLVLLLAVISAAFASPIVQRRFAQVVSEFQTFINQTPLERTVKETSVGIRLQYYLSSWELIKASNWWVGVGTINFPEQFWLVNQKMGALDAKLFSNPHNEYLYMLATKGVVGFLLYVSIFVQACRMAWRKTDEFQRKGLLMFVFLFMLSITTNSMMIDMEEGHFTMLILLIFLAPKSLDLIKSK